MPDRSPPYRLGSPLTAAELAEHTRAVLEAEGATHADAAEAIGVKRPAVSRALSTDTPGVPICTRLLEHYAGHTVDALFRVRKV